MTQENKPGPFYTAFQGDNTGVIKQESRDLQNQRRSIGQRNCFQRLF